MENEPMPELNPVTEPLPTQVPAQETAAPAATKAFPQLFKFLWGGVIVLVGTLLPFGPGVLKDLTGKQDAPKSSSLTDPGDLKALSDGLGKPAAEAAQEVAAVAPLGPSRAGTSTFVGAAFLVFAILLIAQMWNAIRDRRVAISSVLLMFFPCAWSWIKVIGAGGETPGFAWGEVYKVSALEQLTANVGSGTILILAGSTYVVLTFLRSFVNALTGGGKSSSAPAPAGDSTGRSRASSRRR